MGKKKARSKNAPRPTGTNDCCGSLHRTSEWPQGHAQKRPITTARSRATVGGKGQLRSYAKDANRRHLWWAGMCMMCRQKILGHWMNGAWNSHSICCNYAVCA
jgi:hypothetical protein